MSFFKDLGSNIYWTIFWLIFSAVNFGSSFAHGVYGWAVVYGLLILLWCWLLPKVARAWAAKQFLDEATRGIFKEDLWSNREREENEVS